MKKLIALTLTIAAAASTGCGTLRSIFAVNSPQDNGTGAIHNPFGDFYNGATKDSSQSIVLRTKKGDRSVEVELPRNGQEMTDFVIPVSPAFRESAGGGGRSPASAAPEYSGTDDYKDKAPSYTDREIVASLPQGLPEDQGKRHDIEEGLGLMASDDSVPDRDKSYLAALDHIKQLYRGGRYEAGLLDCDDMIRLYPTDPQLHQMKGTLLDRIGKPDLALKAWQQSLRFDPKNASLRRFIDRRQQRASLGPR